jgi:thymidylate kinase
MLENNITPLPGRLYVFEGPDGIGKTTIIQQVAEVLEKSQNEIIRVSFPGKKIGTLGKVIYDFHHSPEAFGVNGINQKSLQVLHIAAHIDCIERDILPALTSGKIVLLDRYWWSTVVYGAVNGVPKKILDTLIKLENSVWGKVIPEAVFLLSADKPYREELSTDKWHLISKEYSKLAKKEQRKYHIKIIVNNQPVKDVTEKIALFMLPEEKQIGFSFSNTDKSSIIDTTSIPTHILNRRWLPTKTTPVFDTYWKFAAERQAIFFERLKGTTTLSTQDQILKMYKFTNTYRASDRVSQYLIKHVIYSGDQSPEEVFFRIMLFKTFNKIETWNLLKERVGVISYQHYDFREYDKVLSDSLERRHSIYSAAYIMPSGSTSFGQIYKHRNHLLLIVKMMTDELPMKIVDAKSMQQVFDLLRSYPMIGDFLAYQYAIDINYSELTNFSEMSFVVPGPGARDGIRKCFSDFGGMSEIDLIKCMADRQEEEFTHLGIKFQTLWGRRLQLIDCQNIFCEVDKYSRIAHPEIVGISGRTKIKQKFRPLFEPIDYFYPPKWGINDAVENTMKMHKMEQK